MEDKRAIAGLWSVSGIGPLGLDYLTSRVALAEVVDHLIGEWLMPDMVPTYAYERIPRSMTLGQLGDQVFERAERAKMKLAWLGEPEYPARLAQIRDAPPLLFYWGPGTDAAPRRRVAVVGCRHPDSRPLDNYKRIIREVARLGVGVVSGAARGIDTIAHTEAADVYGETWAFVGSALDELDHHQRELWACLKDRGATVWSELPPGVRAERKTFPRRNRLISGASDAVCVLRGRIKSGARYTANYAREQNRIVLAPPGELENPFAALTVDLLHRGARLLRDVDDILVAVGASRKVSERPPPMHQAQARIDPRTLPADQQTVLAAIERRVDSFDDLSLELGMPTGQLVAAVLGLSMQGLITEHPGRRFEKV